MLSHVGQSYFSRRFLTVFVSRSITVNRMILNGMLIMMIDPIWENWRLLSSSISTASATIKLYPSNWTVFLLNAIISVKIRCLWYLYIDSDHLFDLILGRLLLIDNQCSDTNLAFWMNKKMNLKCLNRLPVWTGFR